MTGLASSQSPILLKESDERTRNSSSITYRPTLTIYTSLHAHPRSSLPRFSLIPPQFQSSNSSTRVTFYLDPSSESIHLLSQSTFYPDPPSFLTHLLSRSTFHLLPPSISIHLLSPSTSISSHFVFSSTVHFDATSISIHFHFTILSSQLLSHAISTVRPHHPSTISLLPLLSSFEYPIRLPPQSFASSSTSSLDLTLLRLISHLLA